MPRWALHTRRTPGNHSSVIHPQRTVFLGQFREFVGILNVKPAVNGSDRNPGGEEGHWPGGSCGMGAAIGWFWGLLAGPGGCWVKVT